MSRTWTRHAVVVIVTEAYKLLFASELFYQNCKVFFIKEMASSTEQMVNKSYWHLLQVFVVYVTNFTI